MHFAVECRKKLKIERRRIKVPILSTSEIRTVHTRTGRDGQQHIVVRLKKKKPSTYDQDFAEREKKDKRKIKKAFRNF
jgi:hypothetical protein